MKGNSYKSQQSMPSGNLRDLTLQEVADCFDITRERVRQIEAKALIKMRRRLIQRGIKGASYE